MKIHGMSRDIKSSEPIYLGSNFTWGEATKNGTRIPHNRQVVGNIINLAKKLDEVRKFLGDRPIIINSWYRDPATNYRIGGVRNSMHLTGLAADIVVIGLTHSTVQIRLDPIWSGGLGYGQSYTHLDLRSYRARWYYD
jgi:uncharacterized protein YcbK (DUF882 family)